MSAAPQDVLPVDLLDHDLFADHEPWEVFDAASARGAGLPPPRARRPRLLGAHQVRRRAGGSARHQDVLLGDRRGRDDRGPARGRARGAAQLPRVRPAQARPLPAADLEATSPRARWARYEEWLRELVGYRLDRALAARRVRPRRTSSRRRSRSACSAHILGLPEEILPHLIELGDRLLVDTDPEYVGELAYAGEREEDRYKPFGSPWADELCAIGREYYADRRALPARRRAHA